MSRPFRVAFLLATALTVTLLARDSLAQLVSFRAPHAVRQPAAALDDAFTRAIDARLAATPISTVPELLQLALDVSGSELHFGLAHVTSLHFGAREREGNCIEYAHLFATVFNRGAARKHLAARAYVVHSDARVLGARLPLPGLGEHDWVLVVAPGDAAAPERLFVDPTFADFGLGWNIAASVSGDLRIPRSN